MNGVSMEIAASLINVLKVKSLTTEVITSNNLLTLKAFTCNNYSLRKKCPYSELFWSSFSRIRTEYRDIQSISLHIQSKCGEMVTRITANTNTFRGTVRFHKIYRPAN